MIWAWMSIATDVFLLSAGPILFSFAHVRPDFGRRTTRRCSGKICQSSFSLSGLRVVLARLLEMLHDLGAQRRLLLRRPGTKALAAFEAELTLRHQFFEIGRRAGAGFDRRQHGLVDREREIGADQIGVLQR